jgi:hypothetical protein
MDVTIQSSRVAARRRHVAERPGGSATFAEQEKRNDPAKAIAAAAAAAGTRAPTLSWEFQPLSFDQSGAPGESTVEFLEKLSIRIAMRVYCSPGAVLRRLFRVISYTPYGLNKLLLYWHDNRQRLPIRRLLCLHEYSKCYYLPF